MRAAVVVALLGLPAAAAADVWQDRVIPCGQGDELALTSSSRILYVNDCAPGKCNVTRGGNDSSITNTSSIANRNTVMPPYLHGAAHFAGVVECVKKGFAPFDITVVTEDPGQTPHYEVMVGGTSADLNPSIEGAGGIAPFIACNANRNNGLAFVFASQTSDPVYLCTAIVHEAGHLYGLSHSLDRKDPMTYQDLNQPKSWQNSEARCGTEPGNPQPCRCFPSTQNSFRNLRDSFGLHPNLGDTSVILATPKDGQWVKPGFPVSATMDSPLAMLDGGLAIDGGARLPISNGLLVWNASADIAPGAHTVAVSVTDFADRDATTSVSVNVMSKCGAGLAACESGFHCLGGFCLPGKGVSGGLGEACTANDQCVTGSCGSDGETAACTTSCDAGDVCPDGFACLGPDGAGVCWPSTAGGGCSSSSSSTGGWLALGLVGLVAGLRRRR
ncbi:MAG: hypothetical protein KIT31_13270 [Deltaproteobacteria bacterium]|nr:hypothetical protein [Deltaproteobacteria bacterium]